MIRYRSEFPPNTRDLKARNVDVASDDKDIASVRGPRRTSSRPQKHTKLEARGAVEPVNSAPRRGPSQTAVERNAATDEPAIQPLLHVPAIAAVPPTSRERQSRYQQAAESFADALQFLRLSDVCHLLRISKPTLWRLRRTDVFPEPIELTDRVIAWRRSEIEAWLAERGAGSVAGASRASVRCPAPLPKAPSQSPLMQRMDPATRPVDSRRKTRQQRASDGQLALPLLTRS